MILESNSSDKLVWLLSNNSDSEAYVMGFIDAYKHLEKLCGDMLHDDRRLSAYIDEMLRLSNGARYVRNWDYDLKQLKHYRWVRNQIVHEPGHTEQNMCARGYALD